MTEIVNNKNSIAFRNGIRKYDIILSINNIAVKSIKDVQELSRKNKDQIVLNVRRGNRSAFILLR